MPDSDDTAATATDTPQPGDTDTNRLGDNGVKALQREREQRRALEAEVKSLRPLADKARQLEEAGKTEVQKAADRATEAERKAAEAEMRALRLEVAADKGLTPTLARRLVGSTRDELEADADELLASVGDRGPAARASVPGRPAEATRAKSGASDPTDTHDTQDWFRAKFSRD